MEFREQLSRIRKDRGYNQEQLAERVGVSRQAVSKWETGDAQPALSQLIALADALDVSLDALCCRDHDDRKHSRESGCHNEDRSGDANHRVSLLAAFLPLLLAALIVGGMYFHLYVQNVVPSESAVASTRLPDTIEVTGLNFWAGEAPHQLHYEFAPSVVNDDFTYTLTFIDSAGQPQSFEIQCENGVCRGVVNLSEGNSFTAALEIDCNGERRVIALATDLTFGDGRVSWTPVQ